MRTGANHNAFHLSEVSSLKTNSDTYRATLCGTRNVDRFYTLLGLIFIIDVMLVHVFVTAYFVNLHSHFFDVPLGSATTVKQTDINS